MKKFAIAAALTVFATGAFAQSAPFYIGHDGQMFYPNGSPVSIEGMSVSGQASAMSTDHGSSEFPGGNINWSDAYSGR